MSRQQPEYRLQCALARHIRARLMPNVYYTALPFGEKRSAATGARLKAMGVRAGAPDMFFLVEGRSYGLELKVKGGRITDSQQQTEAEWNTAGGWYRCVHGMDEALATLVTWGVIRADASKVAA